MTTPHNCNACSVYIYDVLNCEISDQDIYYGYYNFKGVKKILPELVKEFQRIASDHYYEVFDVPDPRRSMHIIIRVVEEGLVMRTGITYHGNISRGKPHQMAYHWVNHYFRKLSTLQQIHREHSGVYVEPPPLPLPRAILLKYQREGFVHVDLPEEDSVKDK